MKKFLILCLGLIGFIFALNIFQTEQERTFLNNIRMRLNNPGDTALVSDIYPKDWTYVCVRESDSLSGTINKDVMRAKFGDDVLGIEPFKQASASDFNWVLVFFTPKKSIEFLEIYNKDLTSFGAVSMSKDETIPICRERNEAIFELVERKYYDNTVSLGVLLTTKNSNTEKNH